MRLTLWEVHEFFRGGSGLRVQGEIEIFFFLSQASDQDIFYAKWQISKLL